VDLLDDLREETGDQKAARRKGLQRTQRRNAQALLLARLPPSIALPEAVKIQQERSHAAG